jgi:putative membrane protein
MVALFGYFVYQWIVPFDLRKELEIDQNTSLGIVVGAIILGLCIIVAAAISSPG